MKKKLQNPEVGGLEVQDPARKPVHPHKERMQATAYLSLVPTSVIGGLLLLGMLLRSALGSGGSLSPGIFIDVLLIAFWAYLVFFPFVFLMLLIQEFRGERKRLPRRARSFDGWKEDDGDPEP